MAQTCCVNKCSNSAYWLNKWKRQLCDTCGCLHKDDLCKCEPPFRLFTFPTKKKLPKVREQWKQLVGRRKGAQLWSPPKDSRVCSQHFIDGEPTWQNPLPTRNLGYDGAETRVKRMLQFEATKEKKAPTYRVLVVNNTVHTKSEEMLVATPIFTEDPEEETLPTVPPTVHWFTVLMVLFLGLCNTISGQNEKIKTLMGENQKLKDTIAKLKNTVYTEKILKTDNDIAFYTGLPCKSIFTKLHSFISPLVNRRWTGVVSVMKRVRTFKSTLRFGPDRKMTSKSEFLMTLMKLRLGLLNKDLAKRFDISESLCSRIFFTWLRASASVLKSLVYLPSEEELTGSKPERFRKLPNLHSIIDCTELFIETPKDLFIQSATWSDYKHHNTLKILVVCSPNSSIIYTSPAYLGRISDKALTLDCGYLDKLPLHSMVMADKGFNILDDCAERGLHLYIPPGRRGHSQMSSASVEKTKRIANHRILIEQVIRRLKTFRLLANEIPISLIGHVDEIVTVCAALCNLREPIYKV